MLWRKLGIVYRAPEERWASRHAMIPTPVRFDADTIRVYATFCDPAGIGRPRYVAVSAAEPTRVLLASYQPLFDVGEPGRSTRVACTCSITSVDDRIKFLYYAGFELGTKLRYRLPAGLSGFDDEAIMYAAPFAVDGRLFVFYNSSDFGRASFGAAMLEGE